MLKKFGYVLDFRNLEVTTSPVTLMKNQAPHPAQRDDFESPLRQDKFKQSFQSFFIETMELILTHTGRLNFTQMARCGRSCESRFRQNFRKSFDWLSFNRSFLESTKGHRIAIAIDPCYISKSGKKTPGIDWFWSGCAAAMKKVLRYSAYPSLTPMPGTRSFLKPGRPSLTRSEDENMTAPRG